MTWRDCVTLGQGCRREEIDEVPTDRCADRCLIGWRAFRMLRSHPSSKGVYSAPIWRSASLPRTEYSCPRTQTVRPPQVRVAIFGYKFLVSFVQVGPHSATRDADAAKQRRASPERTSPHAMPPHTPCKGAAVVAGESTTQARRGGVSNLGETKIARTDLASSAALPSEGGYGKLGGAAIVVHRRGEGEGEGLCLAPTSSSTGPLLLAAPPLGAARGWGGRGWCAAAWV